MAPPKILKPSFEHLYKATVTNNPCPRISWQYEAALDTVPSWVQTSYELKIRTTSLSESQIFRVDTDESVLVPWPLPPLQSREWAVVEVRAFGKAKDSDEALEATSWSEQARIETGLLNRDEWKASFIISPQQRDTDNTIRPIQFWKDFRLPGDVVGARLYITALGVFDVFVNGQKASDECLAPGWTSYNHRLTYRVLDVAHLLKSTNGDDTDPENTLCIHVAEGWYSGRLGFKGGKRFWYGNTLAALAQLEILTGNGITTLSTDETWQFSESATVSSGIYDGEMYDHRLEMGTLIPPADLSNVETIPWPETKIRVAESPPVRVIEELQVQEVIQSPSGKTILDFGQNLVGKLSIKALQLSEGSQLILRHAEVLEHDELGTRPLRFAKATDKLIGSDRLIDRWTPSFTFHGFRYVEIEGWPDDAGSIVQSVTAFVMHSDMKRRGTFQCSNAHVNKLHENVVWSMKGNFLSIPTDCPQRDERLGWTGDIQVFTPTASFLYDTSAFLDSWLEDLADEQLEEDRQGVPPLVVPDVIPPNWPRIPQAVWDDVTVLTPFDVYRFTSDKNLLERQFQSMKAWLDNGIDRGPDRLWNFDRWQLADWLDPSAPPEDPGNGRTDGVLVADAYLIHVTRTLSQICTILNNQPLATHYSIEADHLKRTFHQKYLTPLGNLMSNTQTAIALAVHFNLYPSTSPNTLATASSQLTKLVRTARFHVSTGFAGTPVILHALTALHKPQLAYRMLLEKSCPSWLYPVTMGATTIWERWNSMLPDGTINPGQMTSFNHYALGAVADWLHSTVVGISPLEPGWKVVKVRPVPGGNLTSAEGSFDGPYGLVRCSWTWKPAEDGAFEMRLTVPPNSSAVVWLPSAWWSDGVPRTVRAGTHVFTDRVHAGEWPPKPIVASNQPMPEADIAE